MYNKMKKINDIINELIVKENIDINNYTLDDCFKMFKNKELIDVLDETLGSSKYISNEDLMIYNSFAKYLIDFYLEMNNIEINDKLLIDESIGYNFSSNFKLFINDIKKYPLLSKEKQKELVKDYRLNKNEKSKDLLIYSNQRIILKYAFTKTTDENIVLDLVQEGNLALLEALDKYDLNYNCAFVTYAFYYVRNKIDRAYCKYKYSGKRSIHSDELESKINRFINKYYSINYKVPTDEEIMEELNITKNALNKARQNDYILSLNDYIKYESNTEFEDYIVDRNDLIGLYDNNEYLKAIINEMGKILSKERLEVVIKKLGLENGEELFLAEVARELNLSRQAVHMKYVKSIKQLKKSKKFMNLINNI